MSSNRYEITHAHITDNDLII